MSLQEAINRLKTLKTYIIIDSDNEFSNRENIKDLEAINIILDELEKK